MDTSKKTDLVLIGKTGNGKSSTGNSIIGSKVFKSTGSMTSVTKDAQFEVCQFEDRIIDVVDAPGTNETDTKEMKAIELVVNAIVKALVLNPEGFHAFLLVVKYGVRHTAEEQTAINILKGILGQSFL
ncbi:uncharacterized protein LOC131944161 [Physella acuta]|uniref:uncharacterized protein LOC131944161 n=1 Tax=Physella acuta TaxID=109671 RepID=UPI0027DB90CE|nr:uncharacterized protein LOC131944161 [Physella acuta]